MADCFLTEQQHQTRNSDVGIEADSDEIGFQKKAPPTIDRRRCITKEMSMMQMEISSLALTDIAYVNHLRRQRTQDGDSNH
jgi:hypothetical protein